MTYLNAPKQRLFRATSKPWDAFGTVKVRIPSVSRTWKPEAGKAKRDSRFVRINSLDSTFQLLPQRLE